VMVLWDLICYSCGKKFIDVDIKDELPLCDCGKQLCKDYRNMKISIKGDIPAHYNESLGVFIKSRADLREKLYLTNSRTEDIDPTGGLQPEERKILNDKRTVLDKRNDPLWGLNPVSPEDGLYSD
jgi:hypothetical protein